MYSTSEPSHRLAILSVYDKTGIIDLAKILVKHGFSLIGSGGTADTIRQQGISIMEVSQYIGSPEMPSGLVKTLHPKIYAGILGDWNNQDQRKYLQQQQVLPIDFVIVNLYPFAESIKLEPNNMKKAIDNVDIGGPTLIRAGGKGGLLNHRVIPITNPGQYHRIMKELEDTGKVSDSTRRQFAFEAFNLTATYDGLIRDYFKSYRSNTTGIQ